MTVSRRSRAALRDGTFGSCLPWELDGAADAPARAPVASSGTPVPPLREDWSGGSCENDAASCAARLPSTCPHCALHPRLPGSGLRVVHDGVTCRFARRKWPYLSKPLIPPVEK